MDYIATLKNARESHSAIGAFNVFNQQSIEAVCYAADRANVSTIIQTSTKTVKYYQAKTLAGMVRSFSQQFSQKVFLHLDHCKDMAILRQCVEAGWDSVMFDGSDLSLEDNIALSAKVSEFAHAAGVAVEGELGRIVGVEEDITSSEDEVSKISLDDCIRYITNTHIDAFAPGIGTAHGVYKGNPDIDFDLLERLKSTVETPIVIHGGTGLSDHTFRKLIAMGGCKINVSTALKLAYYDNINHFLAENSKASEPLMLDQAVRDGIADVVYRHVQLFNGASIES